MVRSVRFLLAVGCAVVCTWVASSCAPASGLGNVLHSKPLRSRAPVAALEAYVPMAQADDGDFKALLTRQRGHYTKHGWSHYGLGHFELDAESGVLTAHGGMGLFWYSVQKFGDFVLELEFKVNRREANSGIFLRVPDVPVNNDYINHSFEIQIDESSRGKHSTGAVYDAKAPGEATSRSVGDWNHYRISFVGHHISVVLNGVPVIDWDAEPTGKIESFSSRGFIGLQNHDDDSIVQFRNLRIQEL